jgi:hypothetical protein
MFWSKNDLGEMILSWKIVISDNVETVTSFYQMIVLKIDK